MKRLLLLLITFASVTGIKAQTDGAMNPNNKAYYSRYYDAAPRFPEMYAGGIFQYITDHIQYPDGATEGVSGQINIHAIVDTTGAITDPLVLRSISPEVDKAVLLVLANTPHFQPAMYKGQKVPVFLAVVMNISVYASTRTIKAVRDAQAETREMLWARKVFDVKPIFNASMGNPYKYVADNINYPVNGSTADADGIVQLRYRIDTTGQIKDITVVKTLSKEADQAMIDVVNKEPKYTPATLGGKKVTVSYTFAMIVTLNHTLKTITAHQIVPPPPGVNSNTPRVTDSSIGDANQIFTAVEISPGFPGGESAFGQYLKDNIHYPPDARKNGIQGKVYVQFVVERDGTLSNIKALRSPSADIADEAIRVLKASPRWKPGIQNNQPVRVEYTVPINFAL